MVCYGIFCSGQLSYRKITNKSMEISLTALEIVLLLLNNYFVLRSKDPVFWVYNVLPFEQEFFQIHIA